MRPVVAISRATVDQINSATDANLTGVTRWSTSVVVSCAAGAQAVVSHDLGALATDIDVRPFQSANVWYDDSDRKLWSDTMVSFHASATGKYEVKAGTR